MDFIRAGPFLSYWLLFRIIASLNWSHWFPHRGALRRPTQMRGPGGRTTRKPGIPQGVTHAPDQIWSPRLLVKARRADALPPGPRLCGSIRALDSQNLTPDA